MSEIKQISREELKAKLDRGDDFKLVMTLGEWAFQKSHIPGSINLATISEAPQRLRLDEEIVVYCSDVDCIASQAAYRYLVQHGYTNVRRYSGGLSDWSAAGLPLEGSNGAAGDTHSL
ncbi:MAG: rhodanese-like domain-containing protein [Candidatus Promineifilaceae bacterium]